METIHSLQRDEKTTNGSIAARKVVRIMKFQLYKDNKGEYRWRFVAKNGKIIADSGEGYKNKADCEHGINLVKDNAASAPIDDLT